MKLSVTKIAWVLGLVGLAVLSISAIDHKRDGKLAGVVVEIGEFESGDFFLMEEDVQKEVLKMIGNPEALAVGDINTSEIEEVLLHNPFIRKADVFVTADAVLKVNVEQREPIMRVFDSSGASYYVDHDRVRMPVSKYYTARVVVVTGYVDAGQWRSDNADEPREDAPLYSLVSSIHRDPVLKALVEEIYCTRNGEFELTPKIGNARIDFGSGNDIDEKLKNLKTFFTTVYRDNGLTEYKELSLAYSGQIIGKRKID